VIVGGPGSLEASFKAVPPPLPKPVSAWEYAASAVAAVAVLEAIALAYLLAKKGGRAQEPGKGKGGSGGAELPRGRAAEGKARLHAQLPARSTWQVGSRFPQTGWVSIFSGPLAMHPEGFLIPIWLAERMAQGLEFQSLGSWSFSSRPALPGSRRGWERGSARVVLQRLYVVFVEGWERERFGLRRLRRHLRPSFRPRLEGHPVLAESHRVAAMRETRLELRFSSPPILFCCSHERDAAGAPSVDAPRAQVRAALLLRECSLSARDGSPRVPATLAPPLSSARSPRRPCGSTLPSSCPIGAPRHP